MEKKEEKKEVTVVEFKEGEDIVMGTHVEAATDAGIDYDKLVDKFGCSHMTP